MKPERLLETTFSNVLGPNGLVIGQMWAAAFYGTDARYHLYYQAAVYPNAPEGMSYASWGSVLSFDPRIFPVDVSYRTDALAPGFLGAGTAVVSTP